MAAVNPDADSRELILAAAEAIVAERGVAAASLADIAKVAGVSRGTLYYHYPSKDDLILDIAERHMAALTARFFSLARSGAAVGLAGMFEALEREVLGDGMRSATHIHLVQCAFEGNEAVRERLAKSYTRWIGMVAEELARIGIDTGCGEAAGALVVAALDGLVIQRRVRGPGGHEEAGEIARLLAQAVERRKEAEFDEQH